MKNTKLLIIDPQHDFCSPSGSLYVPGAEKDMERLSLFIDVNSRKFSEIIVTLDSHHYFDIAHPVFWRNAKGENPPVFELIRYNDLESGKWTPVRPELKDRVTEYVKELEDGGKYPLCIWPPHCLIGSNGHQVYSRLYKSLICWQEENLSTIKYITKGYNYLTEHYSAIKAEVPDENDESTHANMELVKSIEDSDEVIVAGEALSHCVMSTIKDLISLFSNKESAKKITVLRDASSPVYGFQEECESEVRKLSDKGVVFSTTESYYKR